MDALGFLEAVTGVVPGAVAAGFMAPALAHFRDLLGRDTRGASIKSRSLATLHKARPAQGVLTRKRTHASFDQSVQRTAAA